MLKDDNDNSGKVNYKYMVVSKARHNGYHFFHLYINPILSFCTSPLFSLFSLSGHHSLYFQKIHHHSIQTYPIE